VVSDPPAFDKTMNCVTGPCPRRNTGRFVARATGFEVTFIVTGTVLLSAGSAELETVKEPLYVASATLDEALAETS